MSSIALVLALGGVLLLLLLNETARKLAALTVLVGMAFGLGWFTSRLDSPDGASPQQVVGPCALRN